MKCNVKGHRLERGVFGETFPIYRTAGQERTCRETDDARRILEGRRKLLELIHANFDEESILIRRHIISGRKETVYGTWE